MRAHAGARLQKRGESSICWIKSPHASGKSQGVDDHLPLDIARESGHEASDHRGAGSAHRGVRSMNTTACRNRVLFELVGGTKQWEPLQRPGRRRTPRSPRARVASVKAFPGIDDRVFGLHPCPPSRFDEDAWASRCLRRLGLSRLKRVPPCHAPTPKPLGWPTCFWTSGGHATRRTSLP